MVLKILYKKDSPQEREANDFARELEKHEVKANLIEADSLEGVAVTQLYDLPARPAILVTRDDGELMAQWQHTWPLIAEVSYYFHS